MRKGRNRKRSEKQDDNSQGEKREKVAKETNSTEYTELTHKEIERLRRNVLNEEYNNLQQLLNRSRMYHLNPGALNNDKNSTLLYISKMTHELEIIYSYLLQKMLQVLTVCPSLRQELLDIETEVGDVSAEELLVLFDAPKNVDEACALLYGNNCSFYRGFSNNTINQELSCFIQRDRLKCTQHTNCPACSCAPSSQILCNTCFSCPDCKRKYVEWNVRCPSCRACKECMPGYRCSNCKQCEECNRNCEKELNNAPQPIEKVFENQENNTNFFVY